MKFMLLTTSEDKPIYLNLDKIISMDYNHVTKMTRLWVSPIDAYAVKESIQEVLKYIEEGGCGGCGNHK